MCAHHLAAAEDALAWTAARAWEGRARMDGHAVHLDAAGLPVELQRRLLLRALTQLTPDAAPKGQEVTHALAALAAGRRVTLAGVVMTGGAVWQLCHAPPRRRGSSRPVGKNDAAGCD